MTTAELGLATTSVATLSASTATKVLVHDGPGKPPGEGEAHPTVHPDPAILWITFNDLRNRSSYSEGRSVLHASRHSRKVGLADIARKFPEQDSRKESKG